MRRGLVIHTINGATIRPRNEMAVVSTVIWIDA
jgi:hypothetical protein